MCLSVSLLVVYYCFKQYSISYFDVIILQYCKYIMYVTLYVCFTLKEIIYRNCFIIFILDSKPEFSFDIFIAFILAPYFLKTVVEAKSLEPGHVLR